MLDIHKIIDCKEDCEANLRKRDPTISLDTLLQFETERKQLQKEYDFTRTEINEASKQMSRSDKSSAEFETRRSKLRTMGDYANYLKTKLTEIETNFKIELLSLPNFISSEVPMSYNKEDKQIIRMYGKKPVFDFPIQDHLTLGEKLNLFDFKRGTKIAEPGFPVYTGKGAFLEWSLINFFIDNARQSGFNFVLLPILNNTESLITTGNLPKFADEIYSCKRDELHLIPTAETPITNLYRDEVLDVKDLPLRIASYSPCFRREAGATGKMTKGLMRIHQFNKLETYSICIPEQAKQEQTLLIENGERILKQLGLHYRLANLPSCDLANQSSQTFDIEIWLPHLMQYSEVSSASNCLDYQSRRANIKFKDGNKKDLAYTLNCSALATPRVMIALLESNQTSDGHVIIPEVLRKYTQFDRI
ncbi:MAG: serine--tRNA ligase [Nanoarchaeota archaeon]